MSFIVGMAILNFSTFSLALSIWLLSLFHCELSRMPGMLRYLEATDCSLASFFSACSSELAGAEKASLRSSLAFLISAALVFKPFWSAKACFCTSISLFCLFNSSLSSSMFLRFFSRNAISCSSSPMVLGAYFFGSLSLPSVCLQTSSNIRPYCCMASFIKETATF